jgi:hypothetical protein
MADQRQRGLPLGQRTMVSNHVLAGHLEGEISTGISSLTVVEVPYPE